MHPRLRKILELLEANYPKASTALVHRDNFQLLVSTILSAQCTDERVNRVTTYLFKKYKSIEDFAEADLEELMKDIKPTGFYRNKAKNIRNASLMLRDEFGSRIPESMEELIKLPGVARKTANIVLYHGMGKTEGIAVDTHVKRLSLRLGLAHKKDPVKIERELMKIFPKEKWGEITDLLIAHGRAVCKAPLPRCRDCFLNKLCPNAFVFEKAGVKKRNKT